MITFIKKLFGGKTTDFKALIEQNAQIIDVRTPSEFNGGHFKKSTNIPLQDLKNKMNKINKNKPVITVCASGMRSASAKSILAKNGFDAYNGGSWTSLQKKLN